MLRMLLAAAVLAATVPACSKHADDAVEPRVANAGKVLAITGKVTATSPGHDQAVPRALAVGDTVASDDIINTSIDGSVDIVLARNGAQLNLDGGQTIELDRSVAWTLPQQVGSAGAGTSSDGVASAGRPSENSSAHTGAPGPMATPPATRTDVAAQYADVSPQKSTPEPSPKPTGIASTPPMQDSRRRAPPTAIGNIGGDAGGTGAPPTTAQPKTVAYAPSPAQVATLRACFADAPSGQRLVLDIDASGAVTNATRGGAAVSDGERACLANAVRAIGATGARITLGL